MTFDEYQAEITADAAYPHVTANIVFPAMGLAGEAGELCDKIKKHWRNSNLPVQELREALTKEQVTEITKELGDVLWYIAAMCTELGIKMSDMVTINVAKYHDRRERGVLKGEGDNR